MAGRRADQRRLGGGITFAHTQEAAGTHSAGMHQQYDSRYYCAGRCSCGCSQGVGVVSFIGSAGCTQGDVVRS